MNTDTEPNSIHPSPDRHKVSLTALIFGLAAAPLAWTIQSVTGYALSSYSCYPTDAPRATPLLAHAWPLLLTLNVAALALSASAVAIAWHSWRATKREQAGSSSQLMDIGEGRTRFLAMCGMLVSGGFAVGTLFTSVALALSPLCR